MVKRSAISSGNSLKPPTKSVEVFSPLQARRGRKHLRRAAVGSKGLKIAVKRYITLIEILIVIALIGIISSGGVYLNSALREERIRNEAKEIVSQVKMARRIVLNYQIPVKLSFYVDEKSEKFYCSLKPEPPSLQDELFAGKKSLAGKKIFTSFELKKIDGVSFKLNEDEEPSTKELVEKFLFERDEKGDSVGFNSDERVAALFFYPPSDMPKGKISLYLNREKRAEISLTGDFSSMPPIKWRDF